LASILVTLCCGAAATLVAQDAHQHDASAHRHPTAAAVKNPVKADATSIAAGQKLYAKSCSPCHGDTGKGDGKMAGELNPKPAELTDAEWKHGSTDGEIYLVIHDGSKNTATKPLARTMTAKQIMDFIKHIRTR